MTPTLASRLMPALQHMDAERAHRWAILALRLYSLASRRAHVPLPLGDIPQVLLAEAYGDYHAVAGVGAFDEQWEQKTRW